MSVRPAIWVVGFAGSVLAHGGLLAILLVAIRPDPIDEQPMPTTELEVQAYQLDRVEARPQTPESQKTDAAETGGAAVAAGAIPQSRAQVQRPAADTLASIVPDTESLRPNTKSAAAVPLAAVLRSDAALPQIQPAVTEMASARPAVAIAQTAAPETVPVAAVVRSDAALAQVQPALAVMAPARPAVAPMQTAMPVVAALLAVSRSDPALPETQPEKTALTQADAAADALPPAAPNLQSAPVQAPDSPRTAPATPSAQRLKAALAFSGGDGDVDPVSVAAFQSFMQPGDVVASGDPLRDGVAGLLAQVPCSRLQVGFDPETATLQVNGHIPDTDLRAPVLAALQSQMGADIAISDNILILPRPQCGALSGIAGVGLPQSTDQNTNPLVIGEDAHARVFQFAKGNLLSLDMTAPDYDAFIYLDYFDADGNVLHLEPNEHAQLRQAGAQTVQQIGAKSMQSTGLKLVIGPPYGQEIAVAFAASAPLYDGLRPLQEPAAPYLDWLKTRVAQARDDHDDFKGEWIYFFVTTAER